MMRKSVRKVDRFEVFKRDKFTCVYCGNTPPSVTLQIDHVIAVSQGGGNEKTNLVTSCRDCNAGKGSNGLASMPAPIEEAIAIEKERVLQVTKFNSFLRRARKANEKHVRDLGYYWWNYFKPNDHDRFVFAGASEKTVQMFVAKLCAEQVRVCMDIALSKVGSRGNQDAAFKYFCGVCWRKIKGDCR